MSWEICGISNKAEGYTHICMVDDNQPSCIIIVNDVCSTKVFFHDLKGKSCGVEEACSGVDISIDGLSRCVKCTHYWMSLKYIIKQDG